MKKSIFITKSDRSGGDSFELLVTFDRQEAVAAAADDIHHMTATERAKTTVSVLEYVVECGEGVSAPDAWRDFVLGVAWLPDPVDVSEL